MLEKWPCLIEFKKSLSFWLRLVVINSTNFQDFWKFCFGFGKNSASTELWNSAQVGPNSSYWKSPATSFGYLVQYLHILLYVL